MFNNLQSYLGIWPNDCGRQQLYIENLKQYLRQVESGVQNNFAYSIFVPQSVEPSQADWELAWIEQTGLPLPISSSANLYWLSEDGTTGLGIYGTAESSSVVTNRVSNSDILLHSKFASVTTGIVTNFAGLIGSEFLYPAETFFLPTKSNIIMEVMTFGYVYIGAAGPFALDFLLDGERVGVQYYDMAVGEGFSRMFENSAINTPGSIGAIALVPDVEAGEHTFAVTIGFVDGATVLGRYGVTSYATTVLGVRS